MKLQLLLDREPIGEILQRTLGAYWSAQLGRQIDVQWHPRGAEPITNGAAASQRWICNATLNAIFLPGTDPQQLLPIRREFSRSVVRWRRPFQAVYVHLALNPVFAPFFRSATLHVSPSIPEAHDWIIIPGNQKIRLLNQRQNRCISVAKAGFPIEPMEREIAIHSILTTLKIPAVPLLETDPEHRWYVESLVAGTPLNRLPDVAHQDRLAQQALGHLQNLAQHTVACEPVNDYADRLLKHIAHTLCTKSILDRFNLAQLPSLLERLADFMSAANWSLPISQTHGDCQPANILVNGERFWIIDWELTQRRQSAYDLMVFYFKARFPHGLAARLQNLDITSHMSTWIRDTNQRARYQWSDTSTRRVYLAVFLLEELQWRLQQLAPSVITATGGSIELFLAEVDRWIKRQHP